MRLVAIGDGVVDYYKEQGKFYPGGSVVNVAVAAKRNGVEKAAYIGIIGTDKEGNHILDSLQKEKIETVRVRQVVGSTGEAVVTLNNEGDRVFVGTNSDIRVQSLVSLNLNDMDLKYINQFDVIHLTISVNRGMEEYLPRFKAKKVSFDFSSSEYWDEEYLKRVCPYINYAFFSGSNFTKQEIIDLMKKVNEFGVEVVGITRGAKPALFYKNGYTYSQESINANVVDTMGAGDAFIGSFLSNYIEQCGIETAMKKAAEYAAEVCGYYGAFGYGYIKGGVDSGV